MQEPAVLDALILFAQDPGANPQQPGGGPWWSQIFLFGPLIVLFYFLLIAPARRENKQRMMLLGALKKNDEVLTNAGIYGVVSSIKEGADEVTLKLEDNAKIRVTKSSIVRIMNPKEPPKEGAPKEGS